MVTGVTIRSKTLKILIVDDGVDNQAMLEAILKPYGECIVAADGLEAVELFEHYLLNGTPFNLVLMDIMMPNMDGQEALKKIRKIEKKANDASPLTEDHHSFIIMQTSLGDPKHLVESYFDGRCNGYITKPFTQDELLEKLKSNHLI